MRQRVLTALVAIPIVLGAVVWASPWPLYVLGCAVVIAGSMELAEMGVSDRKSFSILGIALMAMLGAFLAGWIEGWTPRDFLLRNAGLLFAGYFGAALLLTNIATRLARQAASLWIAAPIACLVLFKAMEPSGDASLNWKTPLWLVFLPIWAGDTAGMLAGRSLGRTKLAPNISPKKTVEGSLANLLAAAGVGWLAGSALGYALLPSLLCGISAGVLGQCGDLFESALKRAAGIKDSGKLLPGHGGVLDRIDSLLLSAPATVAIIAFSPEFFLFNR